MTLCLNMISSCGFRIQARTKNIKKKYRDRNGSFFDIEQLRERERERENIWKWNAFLLLIPPTIDALLIGVQIDYIQKERKQEESININ